MGLRSWWENAKIQAAVRRERAGIYDQNVIASQVPELAGMSEVEGMAYTLQQIDDWKATATPDQWAEIRRRQEQSIASFEAEGRVMPYFGNLWLLRTYQRELGLDVPMVAPTSQSDEGLDQAAPSRD